MQLVGQICGRCQKKISSIAEGDFCNACGQPVHFACSPSNQSITPGRCPQCGVEMGDDDVVDQRLADLYVSEAERQRQLTMREVEGPDFGRKRSYNRELKYSAAILLGGGLLGIVLSVVATEGHYVLVPIGALASGLVMLIRISSKSR